eukprot:CAMPEP_0172478786 /NCGR_PEP_ID=MMETSP1066-20121228/2958_1 /TAXON_ID=671091 /ORGANISM="Coscinodiscus wailesii, Strain CCMP2513" /LENGTH=172 /DNA_ID=CAMNT_0013238643 /DNA_START=5 /DNA_END=520 /DNA_ORIENTATION=-
MAELVLAETVGETIVGGVVGGVVGVVNDEGRRMIANLAKDRYNEEDIKKSILTELQQIQDDVNALRLADYNVAKKNLFKISRSPTPIGDKLNLDRLQETCNRASTAIELVKDVRDKMAAISVEVYATYYLASHSDGGEVDWASGKKEAQNVFASNMETMKELISAAEEELHI